jgi:hypothetical protein
MSVRDLPGSSPLGLGVNPRIVALLPHWKCVCGWTGSVADMLVCDDERSRIREHYMGDAPLYCPQCHRDMWE